MDSVNEKIKLLRMDIDKTDQEILKNLDQRIRITKEIGRIKNKYRSEILDKKRETEIINNLLAVAKSYGIDEKFIISLWRQIIEYSYKVQEENE